jgi:hypothetical protein
MTNAVLYSYLIGAAVTSLALAMTGRQQSRPMSVVVLAAAAWPLLLLGVAQFVAVALIAEAMRAREPEPKSIDDELEELLTEWAIRNAGTRDRRLPVATRGDNADESSADTPGQSVGCV